MKKIFLFSIFSLFFLAVLFSPRQAFALTGVNCINGQPTCTSLDNSFQVIPPNPKVGDWVNFVSGCQSWAADEVTCQADGTCPFNLNSGKTQPPPQGQVADHSGRGLGIDRYNSCVNSVNSDFYKAVRPGTFTWYHGWGDSQAGHQEFPNYQLSDHVNSITFTISANGAPIPTATLGGPTLIPSPTSSVPTSSPIPSVTPGAPPTLAPLPNCYDKLGAISFKKEDSTSETFDVYSKSTAPQTFYLKSQSDANTYAYTITDVNLPNYTHRNSSLQLGNLQFISKNAWTWATPWCKPAIYLYPQKPIDVNVKLNLDGQMTVSNPQYDPINGWNVRANPDGKIINQLANKPINQLANQREYPYLYYEADLNNVEIPKNGFVIPQMDLSNQLNSILTTLGFNATERNDFLKYWLPRLTDRPYYFVTLIPENVINEKEILSLSNLQPTTNNLQPITPDSMIRSRFVFEGLDTPIKVDPITVLSHKRSGFTLADWGGTVVGKSCTDITVK